MRAVAADPSPFAQMAAIGLLTRPDPAVLDAAFAQLAGSRRVDVPLRQHIEELYATRCADLPPARSWPSSSSGRVTAMPPAARSTAAPPVTCLVAGRRSGRRR